jgi:hypothetical protein
MHSLENPFCNFEGILLGGDNSFGIIMVTVFGFIFDDEKILFLESPKMNLDEQLNSLFILHDRILLLFMGTDRINAIMTKSSF